MAKFVNYKKRSVQLPQGYKDISEVLAKPTYPQLELAKFKKKIRNLKCGYCGAPATSGSYSISYGTEGWVVDESCCKRCREDLRGFDFRPENALPEDADFNDGLAISALDRLLKDIEARRDEFMRRKVSERKRSEAK